MVASLVLGGVGCTAIARWYTKNVAHTNSFSEPTDAPDPSLFSPLPPPNTNRPPWLATNVYMPTELHLAWGMPADFQPGDYFEVQASADLQHWTFAWGPVETNITIPMVMPQQFFRVRHVSPNGAGQVKSDWATTR